MIIQTDDDGSIIQWDDEPVNALALRAEHGEYDFAEDYKLIKSFDRRQLISLACQLAQGCHTLARLREASFTKSHVDFVQQLNAIRDAAKKAGYELWPEMDK